MFQAMKRITKCLTRESTGEGVVERAIQQSFLGMIYFATSRNLLCYITPIPTKESREHKQQEIKIDKLDTQLYK